jgi:hypothetical protein
MGEFIMHGRNYYVCLLASQRIHLPAADFAANTAGIHYNNSKQLFTTVVVDAILVNNIALRE